MIRVAVCDRDASERVRLRDAVERCAKAFNINNIEVTQFASADALAQAVARMRPGFFDLCFCRIDDLKVNEDMGKSEATAEAAPEAASIDVARKLHEENPDMHLILMSTDKADAIHAYELEAGFLSSFDTHDDFARVLSGPFGVIFRTRSAVAPVKFTGGVENIALADIQFVESSKRGPVIHLPAGKTVATRGTLQTLFENLEAAELAALEQGAQGEDGQAAESSARPRRSFVKAGSSFIVNLDNVRSAGEGSLIFADGETIIVPVRKRKAVLDALHSYRSR